MTVAQVQDSLSGCGKRLLQQSQQVSGHALGQLQSGTVATGCHFSPGPAHNAQPFFFVVIRVVFKELRKIALQKHHTRHIFQQLGVFVFPQFTLGQNGFDPFALDRKSVV